MIPVDILIINKYKGIYLNYGDKVFYSYLYNWSQNKDQVFPSIRRMCKDLGAGSRNTAKKHLDKLEKIGLLSIKKTKGKASIYTVTPINEELTAGLNEESFDKGTNMERCESKKVKISYENGNPFDYEVPLSGSREYFNDVIAEEEICPDCGDTMIDGICYNCAPF